VALASELSALGPRMDSKEAAAMLLEAMKGSKDAFTLSQMAEALSAAAARMDPKEAADAAAGAAAILVPALKDAKGASQRGYPTRGLSAVGARMEAKAAAAVAAQVVAVLVPALKEAKTPPGDRHELARSLTPLVSALDPGDAAQAAAALLQGMKGAN